MITHDDTLTDQSEAAARQDAALDGVAPPMFDKPLRELTLAEALTDPDPGEPTATAPGVDAGRSGPGRPDHPPPGAAGGDQTHHPSRRQLHPNRATHRQRALADFVRCRDLTCRFPGCEVPAERCDLDHTIAYPVGPTCASNLKCLCRFHHLLKTFWGGDGGWRDRQLPDGTVVVDCARRADLPHPTRQPAAVPVTVRTHRPRPGHRHGHPGGSAQHGPDDAPPHGHPRREPHTTHRRGTPTQRNRPTTRASRLRATLLNSRVGWVNAFHPELRRAARLIPRTVITPHSLPLMRAAAGSCGGRTPRDVEVLTLASGCRGAAVPARRAPPRPGRRCCGSTAAAIVIGNAAQDDVLCRRFARELGATVASVDYRLAPEHPYPAPLEDCYAALTWLSGLPSVDPTRVAIGGASAGGGLAAALALLARDRGEIAVAAQLLVYPMLDDRTVGARRPGQPRAPAVEPVEQPVRLARLPRRRRPGGRRAGAPRGPQRAAAGMDRRRHTGPVPRRGPRVRRAAAGGRRAAATSRWSTARSTGSTGSRRKPMVSQSFFDSQCAMLRRALTPTSRPDASPPSKTTSPAMMVAATSAASSSPSRSSAAASQDAQIAGLRPARSVRGRSGAPARRRTSPMPCAPTPFSSPEHRAGAGVRGAPRRASPPTDRRRRTACRSTARPARRRASSDATRHSS